MDDTDKQQLRHEIGRRLREARQAAAAGHRYTQAEVAAALGKGTPAISAWETGRNVPDAVALRWMGQHYGVSADVLLALKPMPRGEAAAPPPLPTPAVQNEDFQAAGAAPGAHVALARVNAIEGGGSIELPLQDFIRVLDRALGAGFGDEREKHAFIEGVLAAYQIRR